MKLVLLGAPGAGKGTQAEAICQKLSIPQISTGNILREAMKAGTELGRMAEEYVNSGRLVPEDIIVKLVKTRLSEDDCKNGFILDGFPRTIGQADALYDMGIDIDRVIELVVEDEVIMKRLSGRRVCESCGASYHIEFKPTKKDGVCDKCGGKTVLRKDDAPQTVKDRLTSYHKQTEPLEEYYRQRGLLRVVIGQNDIAETTALTYKALED